VTVTLTAGGVHLPKVTLAVPPRTDMTG
jgi:hypothetical protein